MLTSLAGEIQESLFITDLKDLSNVFFFISNALTTSIKLVHIKPEFIVNEFVATRIFMYDVFMCAYIYLKAILRVTCYLLTDSDDEAGARGWHGRTSFGSKPVPVQASRLAVSELLKKNSITYVIYGKQQKDVDSVKREILEAYDNSIVVKEIADEYSELIGQLNQQQV
jgi:hypothetical protein